jgi:hypothetical protein
MADDAGSQYYDAGSANIDLGWLTSRRLYDSGTGALTDGLYYTSGNIILSASNLHGTATFVSSSGTISFSGSDQDLQPYSDDLLAFSDRDTSCFDFAINVNGSNSEWEGVIFAPRGLIEMSGSDNSTLRGSLIGDTIRPAGSQLTLIAQEQAAPGPPSLSLLV